MKQTKEKKRNLLLLVFLIRAFIGTPSCINFRSAGELKETNTNNNNNNNKKNKQKNKTDHTPKRLKSD